MKTAKSLDITEEQRINIAKLTLWCKEHLEERKNKFNIGCFFGVNDKDNKLTIFTDGYDNLVREINEFKECGTCACFAGHGPLAGIEPDFKEQLWHEYILSKFGAKRGFFTPDYAKTLNHKIEEFLFSFAHSNSLEDAILRGAYLLEHGLYLNYNLDSVEVLKDIDSDYKPDWEAIKAIIP